MYKIAIITPIILQTEEMLQLYLDNIETYDPKGFSVKLYLICNKLNIVDKATLQKLMEESNPKIEINIIHDKERSVAGAWNYGINLAMNDGIEYFHILAADVALHPGAISKLFGFMYEKKYDIISSSNFLNGFGKFGIKKDICDFSSCLLTKNTIEKHGWFDKEYKPAYFEDNDYMARIYLKDGKSAEILNAIHYHYGSATIKLDGEARHHSSHWFEHNKQRFLSKWGCSITDDMHIKEKYSPTYDDYTWWPEQDKPSYSVYGGIHE